MITVLTGTQSIPFDRLVESVVNYASKNKEEDFYIQAGYFFKNYDAPGNVELFDFKSQKEIDVLIDKSDLVITHGGTGSIINSLYKGKTVVVVPRLSIHGEHNDDHQKEIASAFEIEGYVLTWNGDESIEAVIDKARFFKSEPYKSDFYSLRDAILSDIEDFMDA